MKKILLLISFLAILSGCTRVFVDNDYRYSTHFKKYQTYAFVDCERDTNILCEDVQQAIQYQMRARGYQFNAQKPNIFVNFSFLILFCSTNVERINHIQSDTSKL